MNDTHKHYYNLLDLETAKCKQCGATAKILHLAKFWGRRSLGLMPCGFSPIVESILKREAHRLRESKKTVMR